MVWEKDIEEEGGGFGTPYPERNRNNGLCEPDGFEAGRFGAEMDEDLDEISLIKMHPERYLSSLIDILEEKSKKDIHVTYLSISRPYRYMYRILKEKKIKTDNVDFIDAISCMAGEIVTGREKNLVLVEDPSHLNRIFFHMQKKMKKTKFILLDSVSTLLIYNHPREVEMFLYCLVHAMKKNDVGGGILMIHDDVPFVVLSTLNSICDKIVEL